MVLAVIRMLPKPLTLNPKPVVLAVIWMLAHAVKGSCKNRNMTVASRRRELVWGSGFRV